MKNNLNSIKSLFLLILLANFTHSCVKEEYEEIKPNEDGSIAFICGSNDPVTKTTLNGLTTHWIENTDKVGLFSPQASTTAVGAAGVVNIPLTAQNSGERAQFSGTVFWGTGEHTFYSYYPYKVGTPAYTAVPVSLPKDQTQLAGNNHDHLGNLDFLVAKPYTAKYPGTSGSGASVSLRYNHLFAILEFQIIRSSGTGVISKVKLTGRVPLGFESGTIDLSQSTPASGVSYVIDGMSNTSNSVTVSLGTSINPTNDYSTTPKVYIVVLPGTHIGELRIAVESDGAFKEVKKTNATFERGKKYIVKVDADLASIPVITGSDLEPVTIGNLIWAPINVGYRSGLENGLMFQWFRPNGFESLSSLEPKIAANSLWAVDLDQETAADKYRDYFLTTGALPNDWMPVKQTEWNMSRKFNPCPEGWRLPTRADFDALIALGSTAVTNPILGVDNMQGRWYGPNHDNPDVRATTAVFLPVTYTVGPSGGARATSNTNSYYWTTSAAGTNNRDGVVLYFSPSSTTINTQARERANGCAIRCVKDVNPSVNAVLSTIKPYDIKYDGATVGGNIEYQGSHPITERGVFYGTAVDPASLKVIASAAGVGEFTVNLTGLIEYTSYFVRAYAKNSAGTTFYGDQYKFAPTYINTESYGGQEVTINGVTWAPWNAGYSDTYPYGLLYQWHRRFGQVYEGETPLPTFANPSSVTVVNYYSNKNKYFYYPTSSYKYDCISPQQSSWSMDVKYNPCPVGWKVPTQAEFQSLIDSGSSGGTGPNGHVGRWFGPNHSGNKDGCIFLSAAGYRYRDGVSYSRGVCGNYWTTTISGTEASFLFFDTTPGNVNVALIAGRVNGLSVRCVKE